MPDPNEAMARQRQNELARSIVLANSVRMINALPAVTVDPTSTNVINFTPRNVGLTLGFLVVVEANVTNGAGTAADLTPFGTANLVNQITYTDLQNVNRVQTTGAHLSMLNSARQGFAFGGAYDPNLPIDYGNNFPVFAGPAQIAAAGTADLRHNFYVPLAYAANDLRGAVYTNIINATQNLQIVLNQTPGAANATNLASAVYEGNALLTYTDTVTVTVYQIFRDQIPFNNGQPILPIDDLNIVYDIKNTTITGVTENQDFPFAYASMRQFLSTFAIYANGEQLNVGTDVNYWSLVAANSTQLWKLDPLTCALFARQTFMADVPPGTYYFDSRDKPIDTITFGNMALNLNASDVQANARLLVLTEAFQQVNQIPYAASLSIGG